MQAAYGFQDGLAQSETVKAKPVAAAYIGERQSANGRMAHLVLKTKSRNQQKQEMELDRSRHSSVDTKKEARARVLPSLAQLIKQYRARRADRRVAGPPSPSPSGKTGLQPKPASRESD